MKLRDFKIKEDLSIAGLAGLLDVTIPTVKSWLYVDCVPRKKELQKIYEKTGGAVTPNDFILDEDDENADPDPPPETASLAAE